MSYSVTVYTLDGDRWTFERIERYEVDPPTGNLWLNGHDGRVLCWSPRAWERFEAEPDEEPDSGGT